MAHPSHKLEALSYPKLNEFHLFNLTIESQCLRKNPLRDPYRRFNPLLIPKKSTGKRTLVCVLSGLGSPATKVLGDRGFEESLLRRLDRLLRQNQAPQACYLFVDAWTFWGGSQYKNAPSTGQYEDYITHELLPTAIQTLNIDPQKIALVGHSSGGYGALHLSSSHPDLFPYCGALSPDCFFEASLLPDLYKAAPFLQLNLSLPKLKALHREGKILQQRHGFAILNAIAMTLCYSPVSPPKKQPEWPVDWSTGLLKPKIWAHWKKQDPVSFLTQRKHQVQRLKGRFFLDVGTTDEFHLQLGVRQIHQWLRKENIKHFFSEFNGGHFESHQRLEVFLEWLTQTW